MDQTWVSNLPRPRRGILGTQNLRKSGRNVSHQGSHQRRHWLSLIQINFGCPEIAESQGAALDYSTHGLVSLPHPKKPYSRRWEKPACSAFCETLYPAASPDRVCRGIFGTAWMCLTRSIEGDANNSAGHSCLFTLRCTQTVPMTWNNQVFMFVSPAGNPKHPKHLAPSTCRTLSYALRTSLFEPGSRHPI